MEVIPVVSKLIYKISSIRVRIPEDLRTKDSRRGMLKIVQEVKKRFDDSPPLLNPVSDMNIKDSEFQDICDKIEKLEKRFEQKNNFLFMPVFYITQYRRFLFIVVSYWPVT